MMDFSRKFIDDWLNLFVVHRKIRTALGKLLWMAQPRDDLKDPVKELSK